MPKDLLCIDSLTPDDIWTERVWLSLRQNSGLNLEILRRDGIELKESSYSKMAQKRLLGKGGGYSPVGGQRLGGYGFHCDRCSKRIYSNLN
jgi:hypothetical protein